MLGDATGLVRVLENRLRGREEENGACRQRWLHGHPHKAL